MGLKVESHSKANYTSAKKAPSGSHILTVRCTTIFENVYDYIMNNISQIYVYYFSAIVADNDNQKCTYTHTLPSLLTEMPLCFSQQRGNI